MVVIASDNSHCYPCDQMNVSASARRQGAAQRIDTTRALRELLASSVHRTDSALGTRAIVDAGRSAAICSEHIS